MPGQKAGQPSNNSPAARYQTARDYVWMDVLLLADAQRPHDQQQLFDEIVRLARRCKALLQQSTGSSGPLLAGA